MEYYKRENYLAKIRGFYNANDTIKVITGVRRCGKSTLMRMIADEIRQSGIESSNIIFINLDESDFRKIRRCDDLDALISSELKKTNGMSFLFIDEIQNVADFEEVINSYRESGCCSIFITGSNSYLLGGELVTKLTGRYIEFEMFPLTFEEYLGMKSFYRMPIDSNMIVELNRYIRTGGFPRTLFFDDADKGMYIDSLADEIFQKDIRIRNIIRKKEVFDIVSDFVISNFGATFSLNSMLKALKANGNAISKVTLSNYIRNLVDAKVLYECSRFDLKSRKSLSGEKKYYLADLAFYFANRTDARINYGPVLENIIFIYARSKGYSVSVGKIGRTECDFILRSRTGAYSYVQVSYTINSSRETEDREYRPLEAIKDNYPKYVVTTDYLLQERNGIQHVNLMDFLSKGMMF